MKTTVYALLMGLGIMLGATAARGEETVTVQPWGQPMFYPHRSSSCGTYDGCREYETIGVWQRFDTERGYPYYRRYYSPYGQPGYVIRYRVVEPNPYRYRSPDYYRYQYGYINPYRYAYRPEQPIYPIYPFYR